MLLEPLLLKALCAVAFSSKIISCKCRATDNQAKDDTISIIRLSLLKEKYSIVPRILFVHATIKNSFDTQFSDDEDVVTKNSVENDNIELQEIKCHILDIGKRRVPHHVPFRTQQDKELGLPF